MEQTTEYDISSIFILKRVPNGMRKKSSALSRLIKMYGADLYFSMGIGQPVGITLLKDCCAIESINF